MLDPIGGFERLRDYILSYIDTAFRVRNPGLSKARSDMLRTNGALTAPCFLEPVLRYQTFEKRLEDLLEHFVGNPLESYPRDARVAFIELALSGLFPGKDERHGELQRCSVILP